VVLGMIPLARELLRMGSEVVMVANSLPAINDVTTAELRTLLESVCQICPVLKVAFKLLCSCLQGIC
jgi:type II pantothenate kinase